MNCKFFIALLCIVCCSRSDGQVLGGSTVFSFLDQTNTAQLSALGGNNVSNISNDVGLAFFNPALLRDNMHQQLDASFNNFLAGIKNYSLTTAFHADRINTNLAFGINYFDYGSITQTDPSGNILGSFDPNDYVAQVSASHVYLDRFWYGMTFKYISSNYGQYKSNGIAFDIGVAYHDSIRNFQVSVLIRNLGTQLKTYDGTNQKAAIPFDIEAGITKRLAKAPIQFSLTAHHLQELNIYYNDTAFNNSEGNTGKSSITLNQLLSHLVAAAQINIRENIEVTAGYNFMRRQDLNAYNQVNGMNGLSFGLGVLLKRIHIRYATGFYQQNLFQQISLGLSWKGDALSPQ